MPVLKFTSISLADSPDKVGDVTGWIKTFLIELKYFLDNVSNAIGLIVDGDIEVIRLTIQTAEPVTKNNGTIVYADGTSWNPGSGAGFYGREAGAWVKL